MQLGRRGTIIYAVKQRLEGIRTDRRQPTVTWDNEPRQQQLSNRCAVGVA